MARENDDKLICGRTARKYLNCSKAEFEILVEQGLINAYRDEYDRWKVSKESVLSYARQSRPTNNMCLITENFYKEIIDRICAAKSSIKIMTADINLIRLKPTVSQGNKYKDGTPFVDFLIEKAKKGVSVQIITAEKSEWFQEDVERAYCGEAGKHFSVWFCARNHAKVVIIDDKIAYVGSANMTRAGLGQPYASPGNFEVGFIIEAPEIISSLNDFFSRITIHEFCEDCHRRKDCIEDKF
jgi:phosphatidylserine/phosphatidylglycerophosphate/cardiolipin synthase-like enzyme